VALIRLTSPAADTSVAALVERIDDLERRLAGGGLGPAPSAGGPSPAPSGANAAGSPDSGPAAVRAQLARNRGDAPAASSRPAPPKPPARPPVPPRGGPSASPTAPGTA